MALTSRYVIVGASLAGLSAAETLRKEGFDGQVVVVGEEHLRPYDRPPLSKQILRGEWEPAQAFLRDDAHPDKLEVEWKLGQRAAGLDLGARAVILDNGETVAFDGLVVATGATPRRLPGSADLEGVHVLRTLDDAMAIRAQLERGPRVCVVGGGFIGAEVAAACECLDCLVLVLRPTDLALVGEEEEPWEVVQRLTLVQLHADPPSILRAIQAANDVDRLDQSPVLLECSQHRVLAAVALKLADQERRGRPAHLQ